MKRLMIIAALAMCCLVSCTNDDTKPADTTAPAETTGVVETTGAADSITDIVTSGETFVA